MSGLEHHFAQDNGKQGFARGYLAYLSELLAELDVAVIEQVIDAFMEAHNQGNTIYFIGNGGSAATASHFASDMQLNTRAVGIKSIKAVSLVDNVAVMTALANDEGYDNVFIQQLEIMLHPGDVVVALSVSGNSPNVVDAVAYAKQVGALTVGCTGFEGGKLRKLADISFHVPTKPGEYGPVEDVFQILDHLIYSYLRLTRRGQLKR